MAITLWSRGRNESRSTLDLFFPPEIAEEALRWSTPLNLLELRRVIEIKGKKKAQIAWRYSWNSLGTGAGLGRQ